MAQMQVFVSHSSKDKAFCDRLVGALRGAGADVWYDEHNLGAGVLRREIMKQLAERPIVIVILSKAALTSDWVQDECEWAYNLLKREPNRMILPVVAATYELRDFNALLYLESMKRVEAPGHQPFALAEAVERTLRLLELTPAGQRPAPVAPPQPAESASDLLAKGKALMAQDKYAEAIPFFERATQLDPRNFDAWANLGQAYDEVKRYQEALAACDRALALNDKSAAAWNNKGNALNALKRYAEALPCVERALKIGENANRWQRKADALRGLGRTAEAEEAERRAKALGG
jgi:tetratricopeptide (TPR) repeat protein